MSWVRRLTVAVTTEPDGSAVAYSEPIDYGLLSQIRYVKVDFADEVDFTITVEGTGETLWAEQNVTASATRAPRQATHGTDGTPALHAVEGSAVGAPIAIADDRIKVAIANGDAAKSGTFHFLLT